MKMYASQPHHLSFLVAFLITTSAFAQPPDSTLRELPDQRTYFSKTYYNARDNTFTTRISPGYVHYLASDGTFRDIDTNLRLDKSGAYYIIDNGLYNVAFTGNFSKGNWDVAYEVPRPVKQKFHDPGKPRAPVTRIRWKVLSYGYWDSQENRYQILEDAQSVPPVVSGNAINYPQIFNGIDIRYSCGNVNLKEEIVLSQFGRDNLPDPAQYGLSRANTYFVVAMEFLLTPNNINVFARRPNGKIPIKRGNNFDFDGDDPIDFEDADSTLHFFFPKDYAWAVNDSATNFAGHTSVKRYFYSDRGKGYVLIGVPWNWINQAPIGTLIIDPTTTVGTSDDVWLEDTFNYDGHSAGLLIGKAADPYPKKRTIIKFDVAGYGIPSGATVLNAQLKMYYYSAANGGSGSWVDRWVQAHQILVSWNETQATSVNRLSGTPWNVAYVGLNDIDAKSSYESTVLFQSGQTGTWKTWNLTALTQKWVNLTATNYGVVLWATNETTNGYDLRFRSSENTPTNERPYLEVIYSTEAATKTVYFLKDHLGSIRATVLDSAARPVRGYDDYDPWGYALVGRTKKTPYDSLQKIAKNKFIGMVYDDEFGVNWFHTPFRPYDGLMGRWVVMDPLAYNNPGLSPYHYARNNPIARIDPLGLDDFYYDEKGNLVERKKYSWWHNLWNADKYYVQGSDKAPNEYKDNKYWEIESALPENLQGKLEGVVENFEAQMAEFINQNAAEGMYPFNIMEVLKKSPEGAQWDLKNTPGFDNRKIYIYDGKGYFNDYVGNVAWATIMANSGWPIQMSLWGGGFYQTFVAQQSQLSWWLTNSINLGDDPRDSNAIYHAYYNTYLNWIKNRRR